MNKNFIFYLSTILFFAISIWLLLHFGHTPLPNAAEPIQNQTVNGLWHTLVENFHHPLSILILQILLILITVRIFGFLSVLIKQPTVIGEIIAGIALGPSLLGMLFPDFSAFLFAKENLPPLYFLSQIGLILFMFIIGMELDWSILKQRLQTAITISHTSISFSYFLGVCLAFFLYNEYAPKNISFLPFALFMGTAVSITAFPVLARIVQERNMMKLPLGRLIITSAAVDDITAWCLLAIVIAIVKAGGIGSALVTVILAVLYVLFMFVGVKFVLEKVAQRYFTKETINKHILAILFFLLFISAYLSELIGIHALFGAFIAGVIIPPNPEFRKVLTEKIEDVSLVLLLPLFFVFTGLRTQIGLLNEPHLWVVCLVIIFTSICGKLVASMLAAKFLGQTWKDSLMVGVLMNTRGLMELVVLNIGYDLGVLSPSIFTMMVIMAIATTLMTSPLLQLIQYFFPKDAEIPEINVPQADYKILLSFGPPNTGARLLQLAAHLRLPFVRNSSITALHLTPSADILIQEAETFEKDGFSPILQTAEKEQIKIETHYQAVNDVSSTIINFANEFQFELMLVGSSRSLFSNDEMGGKVQEFFENVQGSVGVLIDRNFAQIQKVFVITEGNKEDFLLKMCENFRNLPQNQLFICRNELTEYDIKKMNDYDLVIMSLHYWRKLREMEDSDWVSHSPSILVVNK